MAKGKGGGGSKIHKRGSRIKKRKESGDMNEENKPSVTDMAYPGVNSEMEKLLRKLFQDGFKVPPSYKGPTTPPRQDELRKGGRIKKHRTVSLKAAMRRVAKRAK